MKARHELGFFSPENEQDDSNKEMDLSSEEDAFSQIKNELGKDCTIVDKLSHDRLNAFNLAMETVAILNDSNLYVESLAEMEEDTEENELSTSPKKMLNPFLINPFSDIKYDAVCTTGIATCHALLAFGYDEKENIILCLSHSFYFPAIAKEKMEMLMEKSGISSDKINYILIGGTQDSWEEDIDEFIIANPDVFSIAKNETEANPNNIDEILSEVCNVYCRKNIIVVQQFELNDSDKLKCWYSIKINDNNLTIEKFDANDQLVDEPSQHSFQPSSSYQYD